MIIFLNNLPIPTSFMIFHHKYFIKSFIYLKLNKNITQYVFLVKIKTVKTEIKKSKLVLIIVYMKLHDTEN